MGKKKKLFEEIEITGLADKGKGVGRTPDGRVIFVDGVAPGDIVDVFVYKRTSKYLLGFPKKYHKYSEKRTRPFCEHFGVCGGCKLQHIPYENQLEYKEDTVVQAMQRIGKVDIQEFQPILGCAEERFYRNKMEFTFSNKRWLTSEEIETGTSNQVDVLGFHRPGAFDKIVDIKHCFLQYEPSNKLRLLVKDLAIEHGLEFFNLREQTGMMRHVFFRITSIGEIMVILSFYKNEKEKIQAFMDELVERAPEITSAYYCVNPKKNDFVLDLTMVHHAGKEWIEDVLRDVRFQIGPKSFFQTNTRQGKQLFDIVEEYAGLSGKENVYDLYTGIGSIALYIAHKCKQVVGIEEISAAIEDAELNMRLNKIQNAIFYAGDVKNILTPAFAEKHGKPDVLITDPPRAGMHANVVQMLLELEAPKIVYVSCNPATQARDLNLLVQKYDVVKMRPVDMFPQTHHIENVALLELKKEDTTIVDKMVSKIKSLWTPS